MKIICIVGGLGNQMFQYAFYCAVKNRYPNTFIDISGFNNYKLHNGYELERIFKINAPIANFDEIKNLTNLNKYNLVSRLKRKIVASGLKAGLRECEYLEISPIPNLNLLDDKTVKYYWGYFQSEKYFNSISEFIRSEFKFRLPLDEKNLFLSQKIRSENAVSVHIRRGDYLSNNYFKGICTTDYYKNAIKYLLSKEQNLIFYFFSDDIKWVKLNILMNINCEYIDWNVGPDSYKDMQLMSLCKHNIIANSSFSWWGAWLNTNENKIVVSPNKWDNKKNNKIDSIIPDTWIRI
ncbi:MAG TPA: alpha-1,2-fucosyltransferase [Prolixibacteraceae bacterium]|nr:alpha-1,2-fucosyltransferase [Prolixibacteraceae bacterium]